MMMVIHLSGWKITRCILFMHLASLCRIIIICSTREVLFLPVSNKSKNRKNEVYGSVIENEWESFGIYFFLLWKKNKTKMVLIIKLYYWHIWQNHCVILLLTCLLHSLFLLSDMYCECSNKLLLRELVKKREKEVYFSYLWFWHENSNEN